MLNSSKLKVKWQSNKWKKKKIYNLNLKKMKIQEKLDNHLEPRENPYKIDLQINKLLN